MRLIVAIALAVPLLGLTSARRDGDVHRGLRSALVAPPADSALTLPDEGVMPELSGASAWLNSEPLTKASLAGKVVLVDFWTYSCVNCLRTLPYVKAWEAKYRPHGLVVIGIHAPEFDFERDTANVKKSLTKLGITYPVALDNDMTIWNAFHNQYWPAHYFIDAKGHIRHHHFGEGGYDESERVIRTLLAEAGVKPGAMTETASTVNASGASAAADFKSLGSPETYIGYARAARFASNQRPDPDAVAIYTLPASIPLNGWGLNGSWTITREYGAVAAAGGSITYRFRARDVNLVLGPPTAGKPVSFRVTIDGKAPGANRGIDTNAEGIGTVDGDRMYQLYRQQGKVGEHTFTITFDAPGVRAYAFTFG